jgi:acetyl-CoA acetyltransferase
MKHAGVDKKDVGYYEINEAFAAVAIANNLKLGLDADHVNVNGGAVALGHPLGSSGSRCNSFRFLATCPAERRNTPTTKGVSMGWKN